MSLRNDSLSSHGSLDHDGPFRIDSVGDDDDMAHTNYDAHLGSPQLAVQVSPNHKAPYIDSPHVFYESSRAQTMNESHADDEKKCFGVPLSTTPSHSVPLERIQVNNEEHFETRLRSSKKADEHVCVDNFELLAVLGRGAYGKVFQVMKRDSGKIYAMKVLRKDQIKKEKDVVHTKSERQVLEVVSSPFVVNLCYAFQTDVKLYMIMDYIPGGELFTRLDNEQELSEEHARFYAAEIVLALEHMHNSDIIYRDLKPENVLLDEHGHVRLTDFGFAKSEVVTVNATRTFCGTIHYMAPEIISKTGHGKPADWWALGCLIVEMLTGLTPFHAENRKTIQQNIMTKKVKLKKWISVDGQNLCRALLSKTPHKRLGSNGVDEIKKHIWFRGIDWKKLEKKQVVPPYKPALKDLRDISNFDDRFTGELPLDSPATAPLTGCEMFKGFSYIRSPPATPGLHNAETPPFNSPVGMASMTGNLPSPLRLSESHRQQSAPSPSTGFHRIQPPHLGSNSEDDSLDSVMTDLNIGNAVSEVESLVLGKGNAFTPLATEKSGRKVPQMSNTQSPKSQLNASAKEFVPRF